MEQKKCPKCGAMNDSLANFCHSCFAILVPTGGPDLAPGDAGYASGRIEPIQPTPMPSAQPLAQPSAPPPAYSAFPQQPSTPTPSQTPMQWQPSTGTSTRRRRAALPIGIFVVIFFVIRLVGSGILNSAFSSNPEPVQPSYTQPTGFTGPLPNSVGNYPRADSGKEAKAAATLSSDTDPAGKGAIYMNGSKASFVVATLPSLAGYPPADLLDVMASGLDTAGPGSGVGTKITTSVGENGIACAPVTTKKAGVVSVCTMSGPTATAVVFSHSADAQSTMTFTEQLANAI